MTSVLAPPPLRRNADFRRVLLAGVVSKIGTQVSYLAIPLVAITTMAATPAQVGLLAALGSLAWLVVGLPAGAWVDRLRRRRVMLVTDMARAVLFASVPVAWWTGVLTLAQLYAVVLVAGVATVFFDIANQSLLPSVVGRESLTSANGVLVGFDSVITIGGRSGAGYLVSIVGAPAAVVVNALGFVWSALFVVRVRTREEKPTAVKLSRRAEAGVRTHEEPPPSRMPWAARSGRVSTEEPRVVVRRDAEDLPRMDTQEEPPAASSGVVPRVRTGLPEVIRPDVSDLPAMHTHEEPPPSTQARLIGEVTAGIAFVTRHPVLRPIAIAGTSVNIAVTIVVTLLPILFVSELGLSSVAIGLFLGAGGVGTFIGASIAGRLVRAFGHRRALLMTSLLTSVFALLVPFADRGVGMWIAAGGWVLACAKYGIDNVVNVSYRQQVTPDRLLGRMNATMRVLFTGAMAVSAIVAGLLAEYIGVRGAMWVGAVGMAVAWLPLLALPKELTR